MEKKKTKKTNKNREVLRRILLFTRPYAPFIVISFVCAAVSVAVSLIVPVFCGKAIDEMIGAGSVRFEGVMTIIGGIGIVVAVAALAQWIGDPKDPDASPVLPRQSPYRRSSEQDHGRCGHIF